MARNGRRRRRRQGSGHGGKPETSERGVVNGGEGAGAEGGSAGQPPEVVRAEAEGNVVGIGHGQGGGSAGGRPPTAAKAREGDGHLGAEGGEGGNAGLPRAAATAAAEGHASADDQDSGGAGEPRTVATAVESNGHVGASGGAGANDGDQLLTARKDGSFLIDAILGWSIQDATNPDLFKDKIKQLPTEFSSHRSYTEMQSLMLIEETRATLHSKLRDTSRPQFFRPLSISFAGALSTYYVDIDLEALADCSHVVEDGDVLFHSKQPTDQKSDIFGFFGIATGVGLDNSFQKGFRVLIPNDCKDCDLREIRHVRFATNVMEAIVLAKSIESIELRGFGAGKLIMKFDKKSETKCNVCGEYAAGESIYPNNFNDEQITAVKSTVSKVNCQHKNAVSLVWGPPGSGKTGVAIAIAHSLIQLRMKLLVCVPRAEDIVGFLAKYEELFPSFNLRNVLVLAEFDGKMNCESFSKISETTLESRTQEIYCSIYLWRSWMRQMADLLEFNSFCLDNNCDHDEEPKCSKKKFCFKIFHDKVSALAVDIRECSWCLINSLSGIYLSSTDLENINKLLDEVSRFLDLLLNPQASEFASVLPFILEDTLSDVAASIHKCRMNCARLIDILLQSVKLPQLEDRKDREEFCIKHTCLIVCTPASSSCLHGIKPDLIDVLIVDDAAQIRESELLIPLSIAPRHAVLLGDHLHMLPLVKSKMCKDVGYDKNLFERLLQLPFERQTLIKQYMMDPPISKFPIEHFYVKKMVDVQNASSCDYNNQLTNLQLPRHAFFDISQIEELSYNGKAIVESAAILLLLQQLCAGWEFTWSGRPKNTKDILASLRDQKGDADTCTLQASLGALLSSYKFQYACLDPPQDFPWDFPVDNLKAQYKIQQNTNFGSEKMNKMGKVRLEGTLETLKVHGVTGTNKVERKNQVFKIRSYDKVDVSDPESIATRVRKGNIMVCHFRLSRNYFYLKPKEPYWDDETKPFISSKTLKLASHAVMTIGDGKRTIHPANSSGKTSVRRHVDFQNSEGKRFGIDGLGKVLRRSVRGMYEMKI
ncbi:hypothetical protein EJB05_13962, partial [Eragrostis curvula]